MNQSIVNISSLINASWHHIHMSLLFTIEICMWCQLALIRLEIFIILWSIFCTPYFIVNKRDICLWCQLALIRLEIFTIQIRSTENEPKYCKYFKPHQCKLASHIYFSFVYNKIRSTENEPKYCKYFKPHQCKLASHIYFSFVYNKIRWNIYNTLVHFLYPLLYCKQKRHMSVMPACIAGITDICLFCLQ
jgi:hypothetical protein